jgi:hypothetical protein
MNHQCVIINFAFSFWYMSKIQLVFKMSQQIEKYFLRRSRTSTFRYTLTLEFNIATCGKSHVNKITTNWEIFGTQELNPPSILLRIGSVIAKKLLVVIQIHTHNFKTVEMKHTTPSLSIIPLMR